MRRYRLIGLGPLVAFVAIAAIAALACGGGEPSEEEARAQLCDDLVELDAALADAEGLSESSTVEEAEDARNAIEDTLENVRDSAEDVASARLDSLNNAYDDLTGAVQDLPGEDTLGEAAASIEGAVTVAADAFEQVFAELDCPQ